VVTDYKKFDLFGKTFIQKVDLKPPFEFAFPVAEQACFLYMLKGEMEYQSAGDQLKIPTHHSLLLNCINSGKQIHDTGSDSEGEIVIVTFHPDILKKVYDKEIPLIFKPANRVTNQSRKAINNDFLIHKYIEGLLFYFENPSLVNDEMLVLNLKEILPLLPPAQDAETIQVILAHLFSPATYPFKQIIEAHLFEQVGVEDLAQKANLSVSSFKREFKKLYDDSPANYIRTKRLERPAELLLVSNERITDIAFACGFNDLANFTKSFHDRYNVSPSNFRLKIKEG
jgi:AraC-like DNA-binding protein